MFFLSVFIVYIWIHCQLCLPVISVRKKRFIAAYINWCYFYLYLLTFWSFLDVQIRTSKVKRFLLGIFKKCIGQKIERILYSLLLGI